MLGVGTQQGTALHPGRTFSFLRRSAYSQPHDPLFSSMMPPSLAPALSLRLSLMMHGECIPDPPWQLPPFVPLSVHWICSRVSLSHNAEAVEILDKIFNTAARREPQRVHAHDFSSTALAFRTRRCGTQFAAWQMTVRRAREDVSTTGCEAIRLPAASQFFFFFFFFCPPLSAELRPFHPRAVVQL